MIELKFLFAFHYTNNIGKMSIYLNRKIYIDKMIKSSKKIPLRKDTALQQSQGNVVQFFWVNK